MKARPDIDASEYFDAVQDEYWEAWEQLQAEDISEQENDDGVFFRCRQPAKAACFLPIGA